MKKQGSIVKVSGPLIVANNMQDCKMYDVVKVSERNLIGEVIELRNDLASIQVYEETSGIGPGEKVVTTGEPLSVELGPGLLEGIFDGIQRPLDKLYETTGARISRGAYISALDHTKKWEFSPTLEKGAKVSEGDIIGVVQENKILENRILIPHGVNGVIESIKKGSFTIDEPIAVVKTSEGLKEVTMCQKWPVRIPRPYKSKTSPKTPLITGQRSMDSLFPIAKGGTACIPGPFGSGKTVIQHQLAKWSDADIIVYVGCGERGNEMTDVLNEFPELIDPQSGEPLMKRTVLIANTSDMPVAAREASIYTGITIAEYYRDMGYDVAIMADSSSRWAEALREMSGRLEEMPGEEGYPAYLPSRLAGYYERAGSVKTLCSGDRNGSITAISAVSPPGGDLSEPVSQATLRITKVFWGLSASLAYSRHFPAIDWLQSYSLYSEQLDTWYNNNIDENWSKYRKEITKLLQEESALNEIVRLVGIDALSPKDRIIMEIAQSIREDFLQQDAMNETDSYAPLKKQNKIMKLILTRYYLSNEALNKNVDLEDLLELKVKEQIARAKYIPIEEINRFDEIEETIKKEIKAIIGGGEDA